MNYIYLIGATGAARTLHEGMARALEQCANYRRCTQKEYLQRMREIRALDTPAEPTGFDSTASDPASTTPAHPPATPLAGRQRPRQQKEAL